MTAFQPPPSSVQHSPTHNTLLNARSLVLASAKVLTLISIQLPLAEALPVPWRLFTAMSAQEEEPMPSSSPTLWIYLVVAVALVLLGGAFAGLTIALMGQDEIYLQVIKTSGEPHERKHATRVLNLLQKGKHWVLVTLLLGNVITNETLPIVLDRSLGGGWPAVLGSTVLIVIFGEIIPQSVCVRYGLPIGAWMSPLVLVLMWILAPVAWPTAKLLDRLLGEDHGTTYKKAGLKTLVTLHKSLGAAGEQLNQDEVTIISAVLDLKAKPVGDIMTPMGDVFTMSADTVLNESTMEKILSAGYSRIPIHAPDNEENFVGMLLVKMLITYDPEDAKPVRDFALATLPETRAETSCLDIVNFFQEGKSHMVLVSEFPGDESGALGVVTLEDVIEELIGEEIIDESDVFIDVHKAIRRIAPAPKSRVPKGEIVTETDDTLVEDKDDMKDLGADGKSQPTKRSQTVATENTTHPNELAASPKGKPYFRRASSGGKTSERDTSKPRQMPAGMREHLKHLGPSNLASRPRSTRYNTVKIKPGAGSFADSVKSPAPDPEHDRGHDDELSSRRASEAAAQGGVGAGLLSSAGKDASDGVLAVHAGYGTMPSAIPESPTGSRSSRKNSNLMAKASEEIRQAKLAADDNNQNSSRHRSRTNSHSTLGSLDEGLKSPSGFLPKRGVARSGSITEQIIEAGGIKKTVLELTSSSSEPETSAANAGSSSRSRDDQDGNVDGDGGVKLHEEDGSGGGAAGGAKKKRRRKKRKPTSGGESEPLLGDSRG